MHGFEVGNGGYSACATYLEVYAEELGEGSLCLKFVGHSPTGRLGGRAEGALLGVAIDLDDDAVGGIGEALAGLVPVGDKLLYLLS